MAMPDSYQTTDLPVFARELLNAAGREPLPNRGARPTGADFHAYCPNKAVLAHALWRTALEEFDRHASELSQQQDDPIEAIKAVGTAYARFALDKPARFQDIFSLDNGRLATELNADLSRVNTYRTVLQWVTQAIELGLLHQDDPELVAQTLWAGIHGVFSLVHSWNDFPFRPQEQLFSSMSETLMVGVLSHRAKE